MAKWEVRNLNCFTDNGPKVLTEFIASSYPQLRQLVVVYFKQRQQRVKFLVFRESTIAFDTYNGYTRVGSYELRKV